MKFRSWDIKIRAGSLLESVIALCIIGTCLTSFLIVQSSLFNRLIVEQQNNYSNLNSEVFMTLKVFPDSLQSFHFRSKNKLEMEEFDGELTIIKLRTNDSLQTAKNLKLYIRTHED